jgi:phage tail sheath protein FI
MPVLTEKVHAGEFVLSEGNRTISREEVTITGSAAYPAGQVLGKISTGTATAEAGSGNTGDGAMGAVTVGGAAKEGVYTLTFVEPDTDAGDFIVEDPDGVAVGSGKVAVAFSAGGLSFTLADGSADFAVGDTFAITVVVSSEKYTDHDPDATDGSQVAAAVLYAAVDATDDDVAGVAIVRDAEVSADLLTWHTGITADEKSLATAQLKSRGLILR